LQYAVRKRVQAVAQKLPKGNRTPAPM
jgi:hypothetical protein